MKWKQLTASLGYAASGVRYACQHEQNIQIELAAIPVVIFLGMWLHLSTFEWVGIVLATGVVIAMELANSALEHLADSLSPRYRIQIKVVKDMMAGGVLVTTITAVIVGFLIFVPHVSALLFFG